MGEGYSGKASQGPARLHPNTLFLLQDPIPDTTFHLVDLPRKFFLGVTVAQTSLFVDLDSLRDTVRYIIGTPLGIFT